MKWELEQQMEKGDLHSRTLVIDQRDDNRNDLFKSFAPEDKEISRYMASIILM
jgi:hypothetical protein